MSEAIERDWDELIKKHELSGLGVLDFCKREGISKGRFYYARKKRGKVRGGRGSSTERFVEVPVLPPCSEHHKGEAEVEFPGGAVIRLRW